MYEYTVSMAVMLNEQNVSVFLQYYCHHYYHFIPSSCIIFPTTRSYFRWYVHRAFTQCRYMWTWIIHTIPVYFQHDGLFFLSLVFIRKAANDLATDAMSTMYTVHESEDRKPKFGADNKCTFISQVHMNWLHQEPAPLWWNILQNNCLFPLSISYHIVNHSILTLRFRRVKTVIRQCNKSILGSMVRWEQHPKTRKNYTKVVISQSFPWHMNHGLQSSSLQFYYDFVRSFFAHLVENLAGRFANCTHYH